jgi:hypothetical protein
MAAADERVAQLLERWLASVELHARHLELDDAAYARVQEWPKHDRPTHWVVDLARTRLLELRRLLDERRARGDEGFAEALELMSLLTNLLGSEHVERFIPLAQPRRSSAAGKPAAVRRTEPRAANVSRPAQAKSPPPRTERAPAVSDKVTQTVIADAVRLVSWGREWPQLAGLIARLANRPPEAEVWKILRKHRARIETEARRPRD